jgi:hypothetical protein
MKLTHAFAVVALGASLGGGLTFGCAAGGSTHPSGGAGGGGTSCTAGDFRQCSCGLLGTGQQDCVDGRSWSSCICPMDAGMDAPYDGPQVCGDNICSGTESCVNCPADCGMCPACSYAPSCTGAASVPSSPTALASFNNNGQTMYTSGITDGDGGPFGDPNALNVCSYPLLKMRVSDIVIHKSGSPNGLEFFCLVEADDGQSSTLMVSSDYMNIMDGNPPLTLTPLQGTFWGEESGGDGGPIGVKLSQFNINVNYQCYMVLQPGTLQKVLGAIAGYSGMISGIPGNPYGWAFGAAGAAAAAAAALAANMSGLQPILAVQQTIDQGALLKLTNGYTWSIEQTGSTQADGACGFLGLGGNCDWDWQLDIEAWGCAAPKGQVPMTM